MASPATWLMVVSAFMPLGVRLCAGSPGYSGSVDAAVRMNCFAQAGTWERTSAERGYLACCSEQRLAAQALLNRTGDANRPACPAELGMGTHTWRPAQTECAAAVHNPLAGTFDHAFDGGARVVLIGDSVMRQVGQMLTGLQHVNPHLRELSVHSDFALGMQMIPSTVEGCRAVLERALRKAAGRSRAAPDVPTIVVINAGLWYHLSPLCTANGSTIMRNSSIACQQCAQRATARANHRHPWQSKPSYGIARNVLGLNLPGHLGADAVALTQAVGQLRALPGGFPPVLWMETLPQHFEPHGRFVEAINNHEAAASGPAGPVPCIHSLGHLSPEHAFGANYHNVVTTPTMRAGGLDVVPVFAALSHLGELHLDPDCTHWCRDADALVFAASALLHHAAAAVSGQTTDAAPRAGQA